MSLNVFYLKHACYHFEFGPHAIKKIFAKSLMEHWRYWEQTSFLDPAARVTQQRKSLSLCPSLQNLFPAHVINFPHPVLTKISASWVSKYSVGGFYLVLGVFKKLTRTKMKSLKFAVKDNKRWTPVEIQVNLLNVFNFAMVIFPCGWLTKTAKSFFCYNLWFFRDKNSRAL